MMCKGRLALAAFWSVPTLLNLAVLKFVVSTILTSMNQWHVFVAMACFPFLALALLAIIPQAVRELRSGEVEL
jgi:hypothetical protein